MIIIIYLAFLYLICCYYTVLVIRYSRMISLTNKSSDNVYHTYQSLHLQQYIGSNNLFSGTVLRILSNVIR